VENRQGDRGFACLLGMGRVRYVAQSSRMICSASWRGKIVKKWLNKIAADIASGKLVPAKYFQELDCDACLDARDKDEHFDAEWARINQAIEENWDETKVDGELFQIAEDIRRESFLAVSRATKQHEIASYVSDDFDLIVRAKFLGVKEKLLIQMWAVYERGAFPYPPL
jgi:hypothetical protein